VKMRNALVSRSSGRSGNSTSNVSAYAGAVGCCSVFMSAHNHNWIVMATGADIENYLERLVDRLRDRLGDELVGVWLFGSGALGELDPATSDLDVQAVTTARLGRGELRRLAAEVSHPGFPCPVRGLELVIYARADLDDPLGPAFQLNLNTGPRMEQHVALDPGEDPRFWFVLDVAIGREVGRALLGPRPDDVFPPMPEPLVRKSLREALEWFATNDTTGAQTALAAARAFVWTQEGRWVSKRSAAAWLARWTHPRPPR
jgi:hypothetical protein